MFHLRLKNLRESENLSRENLAKKLEITYSALSKYETGARQPDYDLLEKIANFFGVTTDYLLGITNNRTQTQSKEEKDIAKRIAKFKDELEHSDGLAFDGEPMSDEAKESLLESMELLFKQTQRINKKFAPKKYRDE